MEIIEQVSTVLISFVVIGSLGLMTMVLSVVMAQLIYGLFE